MSNSVYIPAQRMCTRCNYVGREDADHCKGCGVSFHFGKPDASTSTAPEPKHLCCGEYVYPGHITSVCDCGQCALPAIAGKGVVDADIPDSGLEFIKRMMSIQTLTGTPCMWDSVKPGQPMGMVCGCPKCSVFSMSTV